MHFLNAHAHSQIAPFQIAHVPIAHIHSAQFHIAHYQKSIFGLHVYYQIAHIRIVIFQIKHLNSTFPDYECSDSVFSDCVFVNCECSDRDLQIALIAHHDSEKSNVCGPRWMAFLFFFDSGASLPFLPLCSRAAV